MQAKRRESAPAKVGLVQSYMRKTQKWMRRDTIIDIGSAPGGTRTPNRFLRTELLFH